MTIIAGKPVGPGHPPFIALEAGATHGGVDGAVQLMIAARAAGADAIKYQMVYAANLERRLSALSASQAGRQAGRPDTTTYRDARGWHQARTMDLIRERELSRKEWHLLGAYVASWSYQWFVTPDTPRTIKWVRNWGVCAIKIAGADMGEKRLIEVALRTGLPVLFDSRGDLRQLNRAMRIANRIGIGTEEVVIVHTPMGYPAAQQHVERVAELRERYPETPIGYTSHAEGGTWDDCLEAVRLGASYIERGVTLDRSTPGIEHIMSLEPHELRAFVKEVHAVWRYV